METTTKTPVDIIQELLAIFSTRKEVAEKLVPLTDSPELKSSLEKTGSQSDQFIEGLMEELSHFGDAVQGETARDNNYHTIWQKAFQNIDEMTNSTAASTFEELESALREHYASLETQQELPESLRTLLDDQRSQLK